MILPAGFRFRAVLTALALALTSGLSFGQAMQDGVTLWLWDLSDPVPASQQPLTSMPQLNPPTETPNLYAVYSDATLKNVDLTGPWTSPYATGNPPTPDLASYLYGHVWGNIKFPTAGTYQFRLTSQDGSKLFINNALVIDNDHDGLTTATASLSTLAGSIPFYINFWHNTGTARVLLEWMPPGATSFVPVPATSFETQQGQTLVTGEGKKAFIYANGSGGSAGGPGDGQQLVGVHPSFTLGNFRPSGFKPAVGGIDFLPDGRMVICTWDSVGAVYILGNLNGPGAVTVSRFASGLGEPLGVKVVNGIIYVSQKREVTKLIDNDGDGIADEYQTVAQGWPASANYHEFTFNLIYKDGYFWVTTSTPLKSGDTTYLTGTQPGYPVPWGPGSLIRISESAHTWEIVSNGLRTPNGMGIGVDGELFGGDNQGDWLPACKILHLRPGQYYGVTQSSTQPTNPTLAPSTPFANDGAALQTLPPALWLPYPQLSNSDTQPALIPTGTYAGQMIIGELTAGGLNRVFMEKIAGQYQGCVFAFTEGLESGINRLAWGPDGSLYVGGLGSGGNWNWQGTTYGLQRLVPNGNVTFEMKTIQSRADGFEIEFTQPVPATVLGNTANYKVQQYHNDPMITYGGGNVIGTTTLSVSAAQYSADRRKVFLSIPNLQTGRVTYFRLKNFVNDSGVSPWATESWYTLNNLSPTAGPSFTPVVPPVAPAPVGTTTIYEAENAAFSPPTLLSAVSSANLTSRPGYTGSGYLDYQNASGDYIEWTVTTPHAGLTPIAFRYAFGVASGTSTRPLAIAVNGVTTMAALAFPSTGINETGWGNYQTVTANVYLNKGSNTIRATATGSSGPNMDHLEVTTPVAPPANATVLYDGTTASVANWMRAADGGAVNWQTANGTLMVNHTGSPNDLVTTAKYQDFQMHAEFLSPAGGTGQLAGNSGIKLQRRYELQILNNPASTPIGSFTNQDVGSIYLLRRPDVNASTGPNTWQSYDAYFTAARWSGTTKVSNARVTLYWNGVLVHNDVEIPANTGESPAELATQDGILLQEHVNGASGEVQFRNIWVIPSASLTQQVTTWTSGYQLTGADAAMTASPAHDGLTNLQKYAFGASPLRQAFTGDGHPFIPAMSLPQDEAGNSYVQFFVRRRIDYAARGLQITIESSPDLSAGSWTTQPSVEVGVPASTGDGVTEMATYRVTQPLPSGTTSVFTRVKVELLQ